VAETSADFAAAGLAGVGQWTMDLTSGVKHWDGRTRAIFGLGPEEPVPDRSTWRERFLWPDDVAESDRRIAESLRSREPYEMEFRIRRADGALRWLFTRAIFNPGNPNEVLGVTMDITELRTAAPEPAPAVAPRPVSETARLNHELRTPLNAVIGFAQLLEIDRAQPLTPEQRQRVQAIQSAAWKLLGRIDALLAEDPALPRLAPPPPEPVDPD
jgi:PAS domain S-box-containing protein